MNTHGLERTSPKGGPFIGRCTYCGKDNLPMAAALEPCLVAPSQDEQILDAIDARYDTEDAAPNHKGDK